MQYEKTVGVDHGDGYTVVATDFGQVRADVVESDGNEITTYLDPSDARSLARALKRAANVAEGKPAKAKKAKPAEIVDGESDRWVLNDSGTYDYEFADGNAYYMARSRKSIRRQFGISGETA